jgi:membrane protease YdiL (CAAX protease family)
MGWDVNSVQGVGRVGGEAAAVLVVLALAMLAPLALVVSVLFGGDTPVVNTTNRGVLFLFAFSVFPGSALGEEVGWRGFALPRMQVRQSPPKRPTGK